MGTGRWIALSGAPAAGDHEIPRHASIARTSSPDSFGVDRLWSARWLYKGASADPFLSLQTAALGQATTCPDSLSSYICLLNKDQELIYIVPNEFVFVCECGEQEIECERVVSLANACGPDTDPR